MRRDTAPLLVVCCCAIVVLVIVWSLSRLALLYVLTDGIWAACVLAAASLFGLWIVPVIIPQRCLAMRWQLALGAGLGIGLLCLLLLGLGLFGQLGAPLWWGVLGFMGLAGVVRLSILWVRFVPSLMPEDRRFELQPPGWRFNRACILLVGLMPFLALALLVATVPPGILWAEEARGYDVLEYHLQVPKEYFLNGRIEPLAHNIYSNFPMNAEMLYMLAMVLKQDPLQACVLAKLLNAMLAALFVMSAWLVGREYHPTAGVLSALLAGSAPWVMYLCGVAYVENGMLFFGMLATACVCLYERRGAAGPYAGRLALLAGILAGLACGFKYTAAALIALPLFVVISILAAGREGRPWLRHPLCFVVGAAVTFSPWLIKNLTMTGNPVFPLAYGVFGATEGTWTEQLAEQWASGHRVEPDDASPGARLARFKQRVLLDGRLGWGLPFLAVPILVSRARSRVDVMLLLILLIQAAVWISFTHLYARFAVVMLIPLCILGGRSILAAPGRRSRVFVLAAVSAVVIINLLTASSIYAAELTRDGRSWEVHGHVERFYKDCDAERTPALFLREHVDQGDRVLMVGEARAFYMPANVDYCVVFSRNPLADAVAAADDDEAVIRWLNEAGYTHLLVHWNEIERLRSTYGFWDVLTPALFERLKVTGLAPAKHFRDQRLRRYATLFEVRQLKPADED